MAIVNRKMTLNQQKPKALKMKRDKANCGGQRAIRAIDEINEIDDLSASGRPMHRRNQETKTLSALMPDGRVMSEVTPTLCGTR